MKTLDDKTLAQLILMPPGHYEVRKRDIRFIGPLDWNLISGGAEFKRWNVDIGDNDAGDRVELWANNDWHQLWPPTDEEE